MICQLYVPAGYIALQGFVSFVECFISFFLNVSHKYIFAHRYKDIKKNGTTTVGSEH
jgi:hypothetical protein